MSEQFYYRIENRLVSAGVDEWDNPCGPPRVHVHIMTFRVLSKTPKGVWIEYYGSKRFVLTEARKHFACPNLEEAKQSFKARKMRQRSILNRQLQHVDQALDMLDDVVGYFEVNHGVSFV